MADIFKSLAEPFPTAAISWRVGSTTKDKSKGMALAYIDARDVMDRLDAVVGPANWQDDYTHASKDGYICKIGIRVDGEWVWKANGAGETQVEAEKGAASDAFKRAAVLWGIGRYLYSLDSPWVALENGRIVSSEYAKLNACHDRAIKPARKPAENPQTVENPPAPRDDEQATFLETKYGLVPSDWVAAGELRGSAELKRMGVFEEFINELPECVSLIRMGKYKADWKARSLKERFNHAYIATMWDRIVGQEQTILENLSPDALAEIDLKDALKHSLHMAG